MGIKCPKQWLVPLYARDIGNISGGSDFDHYGTVGYSLEQKLAVIKGVEV